VPLAAGAVALRHPDAGTPVACRRSSWAPTRLSTAIRRRPRVSRGGRMWCRRHSGARGPAHGGRHRRDQWTGV